MMLQYMTKLFQTGKYNSYVVVQILKKSIEKNKTLIRAFPNPFNNVLQINGEFEYIEIYNLLGVKIKTCSNNKVVNLPNLISGTYICKIYTTNNSIEYLKIVKL